MKNNIKEWLAYFKDELWYAVKFDNLVYLLVGVIAAGAATLVNFLVVNDWWAFAYAALGGIITFFSLKFIGDPYKLKGVVGWSLIAFAILTLSTALLTGLLIPFSYHVFGCLVGLVLLLLLLCVSDVIYFWIIGSFKKYIVWIGIVGGVTTILLSFIESNLLV